jgi:hypothetical protein
MNQFLRVADNDAPPKPLIPDNVFPSANIE